MQWLNEETDRYDRLWNEDTSGPSVQARVDAVRHREDPVVKRPDVDG